MLNNRKNIGSYCDNYHLQRWLDDMLVAMKMNTFTKKETIEIYFQ